MALQWIEEEFYSLELADKRLNKRARIITEQLSWLVVAWRVEQVKIAARVDGCASCEKYFEASEWNPAFMVANKSKNLPTQPPTIAEFTILLAKLEGYIDKKAQGPPGSMTLWRGLRKLEAYRDAYLVFGVP